MAASRQFLLRLNNASSNSGRLFSSSAALMHRPWTHFSDGESAVYKKVLKLQRPTTVKYEDCLPNSVSLIGAIQFPFKVCENTDRFGVHTAVRVNAPTGARCSFGIRVGLILWEEVAEMAVQHLKLNDLVYVSGRLGSYVKVDENGKSVYHYKVVVKEVNFVSRNALGPANQNLVNLDPEVSCEEIKQKRRDHLHLWQIFFASPSEWWDDRNRKRNPRAPDFKHKDTGEALWLSDNDPPWVHKQLKLHDSRLFRQSASEHRNLSPLVYE